MFSSIKNYTPSLLSLTHHALGNLFMCRFHDANDEPVLDHDIVPYLDDNVQLSIKEYREKIYEVIFPIHTHTKVKLYCFISTGSIYFPSKTHMSFSFFLEIDL